MSSQPVTVAFLGLGMMGLPMARRILTGGFALRGFDLSADALAQLTAAGGFAASSPREAADGASVVITMLPNGKIVRDALLGENGAAAVLAKGGLVIDMSSSAPVSTQELGEALSALGLKLIDAPVSGGVKRAIDGSLAIMAGGDAAAVDQGRPVLDAMGKAVIAVGPLGAGHAMKALNNYVSAAGLAALSEALIVGQKFGIAGDTIVDVLNISTGRNNSTELKAKPFMLSGSFASGFALALMAKDIRIAADLADQIGTDVPGIQQSAELWAEAQNVLGAGADHTEIYRYLLGQTGPKSK